MLQGSRPAAVRRTTNHQLPRLHCARQATAPPPKLKRKMVYFLKLARVALVKEDIRKLVGGAAGTRLWAGPARQRCGCWTTPRLPTGCCPNPHPLPLLQVVSGELSDALLDQLSALSSEVFLPLISSNKLPMAATPAAAVKGVAEGMHKFVASGGQGGCRAEAASTHHPAQLPCTAAAVPSQPGAASQEDLLPTSCAHPHWPRPNAQCT